MIPQWLHLLAWFSLGTAGLKGHVSNLAAVRAGVPNEEDVRKAAEILNAGQKIVIMSGAGAIGSGPFIEHMAERLGSVR